MSAVTTIDDLIGTDAVIVKDGLTVAVGYLAKNGYSQYRVLSPFGSEFHFKGSEVASIENGIIYLR